MAFNPYSSALMIDPGARRPQSLIPGMVRDPETSRTITFGNNLNGSLQSYTLALTAPAAGTVYSFTVTMLDSGGAMGTVNYTAIAADTIATVAAQLNSQLLSNFGLQAYLTIAITGTGLTISSIEAFTITGQSAAVTPTLVTSLVTPAPIGLGVAIFPTLQ